MVLKENEIVTASWKGELFGPMDLISMLHIGVIKAGGHTWKVNGYLYIYV